MVSIAFASPVFAGAAPAGSFDSVFAWIERLRQGEDVRLEIRAGTNTFSVYHEQTTRIDESAFNQLRRGSKGGVRLELTAKSPILVYDVNDNLKLEEHPGGSRGAGPTSWFRRASIRVSSYPLDVWGNFVAAAMRHGLLEYEATLEGKILEVTLAFKQMGPRQVQFGNQSLVLSDDFYDHMKLSWDYKPVAGANGFVILVHDPHWSKSGALQLVPGLRALQGGNPTHHFMFLVEGEFGGSREIGFNSLDEVVDAATKSGAAEPVVYDMLSRFMIDSPMAYRLLYDRRLPAFAIDDPAYLETVSPGSPPEDNFKTYQAMRRIYAASTRVSWPATAEGKQAREAVKQVFGLAIAYVTAGGDIQGQGLVDYYDKLSAVPLQVEQAQLDTWIDIG
jgi:hypothetical protein